MDKITTKMGVYLLRNKINNKIYVGKALNIKYRMSKHKSSPKSWNRGKSAIINAIKKYGWDNFELEILETYDNIDNVALLAKETEWIRKLDSTNPQIGYNILESGTDWTGNHHTEETKQILSKLASERYSGENNPMFGRNHSEETKNQISETKIRNKSAAGKNNPFYGKKHTPETIEKIRQGNKNKDCSKQKRPVKQIDVKTGEIIKVWDSARDAAKELSGNKHNAGQISNVCGKYITKQGWICKTALGYKWEYVSQ